MGTASYQLARYLAKLLAPLSNSEYTVTSTKHFIESFSIQRPDHYKLISFDVSSLFTSVPLEYTINIILKRIYDNQEVQTSIEREVMKELLLLCTKNVHFTFNNKIYRQTDGVAMGSPLGPVISGIFMVELERTVIPQLSDHMLPWKRYVDDTIAWINPDTVQIVTDKLNGFHENIKFTHEMEDNGTISFLDVLIKCTGNQFQTTVFRKPTNNDIYLHWNSFAPKKWKQGTLRTLILRAFTICSNDEHFKNEIYYLRKAFTKTNGYPNWFFDQVYNNITQERNIEQNIETRDGGSTETSETVLLVPYQGEVGDNILKSIKKTVDMYDKSHKLKIIYTGTKLGTKFSIKDKTLKEHENNVVYEVSCPQFNCNETYIGETARRLVERVKDHSGRDEKSHVVRHAMERNHDPVTINNFNILAKNKRLGNYYYRKTMEAIFIKNNRPTLNTQEKSIPLKLFN